MNPEDRKVMEMARDALHVCKAEDVARDVLRRKALAAIEERLQADEPKENPALGYADWQQRRGMALDIISEALAEYDQWMIDDDFDADACLKRIMDRMRARVDGLPGRSQADEKEEPVAYVKYQVGADPIFVPVIAGRSRIDGNISGWTPLYAHGRKGNG